MSVDSLRTGRNVSCLSRPRLTAWVPTSYWDPPIDPETYSFVDYAVGLGYSVLFYDRLGVGESSTQVNS